MGAPCWVCSGKMAAIGVCVGWGSFEALCIGGSLVGPVYLCGYKLRRSQGSPH